MTAWLRKLNTRFGLDERPRLRKFLVGLIGFSVVLIGVIMILLPGPAFVVIPIGVATLATEFAWARRVWIRGKIFVERVGRVAKVRVKSFRKTQ